LARGPLTIREVRPDDLEPLLDLLDQLSEGVPSGVSWDHAPLEHSADVVRRIIEDPQRHLLVAEEAGSIIGSADVLIVPNLTHAARPFASLENVVVSEARRGSGVGSALMEEVLRLARENDCYKVQFHSDRRRTRAHALYERLGFEPSSVGFKRYLP